MLMMEDVSRRGEFFQLHVNEWQQFLCRPRITPSHLRESLRDVGHQRHSFGRHSLPISVIVASV